jgi:hypothetical protein
LLQRILKKENHDAVQNMILTCDDKLWATEPLKRGRSSHMVKESVLGNGLASQDNGCLAFRDNIMISSKRVEMSSRKFASKYERQRRKNCHGPRHEDMTGESGGTTPLILNVATKRRVTSFTPPSLYPLEKKPQYPFKVASKRRPPITLSRSAVSQKNGDLSTTKV